MLRWHGCALLGLGLLAGRTALGNEAPEPVGSTLREGAARACPAGTASLVRIVTPPGSGPGVISGRLYGGGGDQLVNAKGTLFFGTNFYNGLSVLWRTDGTTAGTVPVKQFMLSPFDPPLIRDMVGVGRNVFFTFREYAGAGRELWVSDGTEPGTHLVKDLAPGVDDSLLTNLASVNESLVFLRGVADNPEGFVRHEIWRSDGTAAGTVKGVSLPPHFFIDASLKVGNAMLLFMRSGGTEGLTLWRTDGTASGSFPVKKLDAGFATVNQVGHVDKLGLFVVDDGPSQEVWRTDGTPAGTVRLESFGRPLTLLGALGSFVYVATYDAATKQLRVERVSLNGGGKTLITTLPNPYAGEPYANPFIQRKTTSAGKLFFTVGVYSGGLALRDVALWVSDGTAAGTRQLRRPLSLDRDATSPVFATGEGPVLFSSSVDSMSSEPWFTMGSVETTGQIGDIRPGRLGSSPDGFARLGNRVYFFAQDAANDYQLWSVPASFTCPPGLTDPE